MILNIARVETTFERSLGVFASSQMFEGDGADFCKQALAYLLQLTVVEDTESLGSTLMSMV
jgi:hypothetical protein